MQIKIIFIPIEKYVVYGAESGRLAEEVTDTSHAK
jgi:hypothetical protein